MLALEVGRGWGGKVCCAVVRVVVGVHVSDLCVGAARGEGGVRESMTANARTASPIAHAGRQSVFMHPSCDIYGGLRTAGYGREVADGAGRSFAIFAWRETPAPNFNRTIGSRAPSRFEKYVPFPFRNTANRIRGRPG